MPPPPAAAALLDAAALTASPRLALLRDDTDASDAVPLLLQLVATLASSPSTAPTPSSPVILLTTRTRTTFSAPTKHPYPTLSRGVRALLSKCVALDPHDLVSLAAVVDDGDHDTDFEHDDGDGDGDGNGDKDRDGDEDGPHHAPAAAQAPSTMSDFSAPALRSLLHSTLREVRVHNARVVAIECVHSLQLAFRVHAASFIRALLAALSGGAVSVLAVLPLAPPADCTAAVQPALEALAHDVIDLRDLHTGPAPDIDGTVAVTKRDGHWLVSPSPRRYKISDAAFTIYS